MIKQFLSLLAILFIAQTVSGQGQSEWNQFRGNTAMTGVTKATLPASLSILWSFKTGDNVKASPVISNGIIVVGSTDCCFYGLTTKGKLLWKVKTDNSIEAPALIVNGTVYAGNLEGTIYALDLKTGKQKWKHPTEGQIMGAPTYWQSGNKKYLLFGSYDYNFYCLDAQTGKLKWKYETGNYINGSAAIVGNLAIFGGCDGFLHMVNIETGKLRKKINVGTYVASSVTVDNNHAFTGDYDGKFSCISLTEKKVIWKHQDEKATSPFIASPALINNYIIVGSRDKYLYCFDKNNGKLYWKKNMGGRIDASAVIANNKIVIPTMKGDLKIVNLQDGRTLMSYEIGSPICGSPAVIDGLIVVGGEDGKIYGVGKR